MTSFSKAFAAARKSGKKNFSWQGKSFNTKLAKGGSAPKNVPVPGQKPDRTTTASVGKTPVTAKARADFPKPAVSVGIAKKGSLISKAKARMDNAPVTPTKRSGRVLQGEQIMAGAKAKNAKAAAEVGPKPEGVWYARKGSPMSIAAARRANKPVKK